MAASKALLRDLERIVGREHVIAGQDDLVIFERDGSVSSALPDVVVLPIDTEQVAAYYLRNGNVNPVDLVATS